LCALMEGTVTAANQPEGGACFTVRLALAPANAVTPALFAPAPSASTTRSLRVLVVDDHTAARELLAEALRAEGHAVDTACDGARALAAAAAGPIDVVVLDLNLPDLDGIEVAQQLRARALPARGPYIIGCSAEAFRESRETALAAGMDAFLEKPVRLADLATAVAAGGVPVSGSDIFAHVRVSGQADRVREIFVAEWAGVHADLRGAIDARAPDPIMRRTHYLRSTALMLGDPALAAAAQGLDTAAEAGEWHIAQLHVDALARLALAFERAADDARLEGRP